MLFSWIKQRREIALRAQKDAETLIFVKGERALDEARRRQRVWLLGGERPDDLRDAAHWRRVAQIISAQRRN